MSWKEEDLRIPILELFVNSQQEFITFALKEYHPNLGFKFFNPDRDHCHPETEVERAVRAKYMREWYDKRKPRTTATMTKAEREKKNEYARLARIRRISDNPGLREIEAAKKRKIRSKCEYVTNPVQ